MLMTFFDTGIRVSELINLKLVTGHEYISFMAKVIKSVLFEKSPAEQMDVQVS